MLVAGQSAIVAVAEIAANTANKCSLVGAHHLIQIAYREFANAAEREIAATIDKPLKCWGNVGARAYMRLGINHVAKGLERCGERRLRRLDHASELRSGTSFRGNEKQRRNEAASTRWDQWETIFVDSVVGKDLSSRLKNTFAEIKQWAANLGSCVATEKADHRFEA